MLRNALQLARLLTSHDWDGIGRADIVIGLRRDGDYDWNKIDDDLADTDRSITVRKTEWKMFPARSTHLFPAAVRIPNVVTEVMLPSDRAYNFLDCDGWILFGAPLQGFAAALRPQAVYCADFIQRYVPEIFHSQDDDQRSRSRTLQMTTMLGWRASRCVFATTPQTRKDAIEYAGIPADRALLVPTLVDPLARDSTAPNSSAASPYILWVTNPSPHKNHTAGVAALEYYYDELGGQLPLTVIGANTDWLDPKSEIDCAGSRAFRRSPTVLRHTHFAGEVSDSEYHRLIRNASIVWHNVIVDNGTFVAFDAARAGRHFVCSDYPQMRYLCARYGLSPIWHPPGDPVATAHALLVAEQQFATGKLPSYQCRDDSRQERVSGYGALLRKLFQVDDVGTARH
jgi:glycosyltransferase involved in cell wall biosynthesis